MFNCTKYLSIFIIDYFSLKIEVIEKLFTILIKENVTIHFDEIIDRYPWDIKLENDKILVVYVTDFNRVT